MPSSLSETESVRSNSTVFIDDEINEEASLFIGDLSRSVDEGELKAAFIPYGEITAVEVKKDRLSGNSLGYGFVHFKNRADALEAKMALHKTAIGNRVVRIGWAQKNANLFVGDLDGSLDTDGLQNLFRPYGPLYEEETFVKNRNYGFVRFRHRAHAEAAKDDLDGSIVGTRAIRIGWGEANMLKSSVHLEFNPKDSGVAALTKDALQEFFTQFGKVISVVLPFEDEDCKRHKGFGFIHYADCDEGERSATAAIREINLTSTLLSVRIMCNHGKRQHARSKITPTSPASTASTASYAPAPLAIAQPSYMPAYAQQQQAAYMPVLMPGPYGSWQPVQYMYRGGQLVYAPVYPAAASAAASYASSSPLSTPSYASSPLSPSYYPCAPEAPCTCPDCTSKPACARVVPEATPCSCPDCASKPACATPCTCADCVAQPACARAAEAACACPDCVPPTQAPCTCAECVGPKNVLPVAAPQPIAAE